jgi:hypothetical protein
MTWAIFLVAPPWPSGNHRGSLWRRQGPTLLLALATPLLLADQLRHTLQGAAGEMGLEAEEDLILVDKCQAAGASGCQAFISGWALKDRQVWVQWE